ncbi:hypothetical protein ACSXBY_15430 (plasmid) [Clostridium perfringens]|uniref:Uncharacterized protein n=2 Tax=Clostridium perfringens TaxID=1502 RepID=A0A2X3AH17_CLOPF|nr:hypothetical protein [Clostridium perfringens]EDS79322.1 conserved hypothetical protein [Clostridium perfringens C str. JGS1495]EDT22211.1 conserved hypothetical protein [Clostridium perfringens B str. ATCC 3626]NGT47311.1 hypothetical protein [Clostridium perfringens]NGT53217.1 hypothetical protein [Clostridium perfringens]NGT54012.1 hypothetical protein [Clostridium perfringens]
MANIERVNLRLNLDDPRDAAIWDLVKDKKNKKGTYIKFLIYNLIIGKEISITKYSDKNFASSDNDKNDISEDEFDDDINNEFD